MAAKFKLVEIDHNKLDSNMSRIAVNNAYNTEYIKDNFDSNPIPKSAVALTNNFIATLLKMKIQINRDIANVRQTGQEYIFIDNNLTKASEYLKSDPKASNFKIDNNLYSRYDYESVNLNPFSILTDEILTDKVVERKEIEKLGDLLEDTFPTNNVFSKTENAEEVIRQSDELTEDQKELILSNENSEEADSLIDKIFDDDNKFLIPLNQMPAVEAGSVSLGLSSLIDKNKSIYDIEKFPFMNANTLNRENKKYSLEESMTDLTKLFTDEEIKYSQNDLHPEVTEAFEDAKSNITDVSSSNAPSVDATFDEISTVEKDIKAGFNSRESGRNLRIPTSKYSGPSAFPNSSSIASKIEQTITKIDEVFDNPNNPISSSNDSDITIGKVSTSTINNQIVVLDEKSKALDSGIDKPITLNPSIPKNRTPNFDSKPKIDLKIPTNHSTNQNPKFNNDSNNEIITAGEDTIFGNPYSYTGTQVDKTISTNTNMRAELINKNIYRDAKDDFIIPKAAGIIEIDDIDKPNYLGATIIGGASAIASATYMMKDKNKDDSDEDEKEDK